MPATFDGAYAQWLTQHGQVRAQGVNVLEFSHPKWNTPEGNGKFVSDYGENFAARKETGAQFLAEPLGFLIDRATDNLSTEQRILLRLDNANGRITSELRSLTEDDLQTPVEVTVRVYLDSKRTAPAYDPVKLFATNVRATRLVVEVEASADTLPNVTAGIRYTFDLFPPLIYL